MCNEKRPCPCHSPYIDTYSPNPFPKCTTLFNKNFYQIYLSLSLSPLLFLADGSQQFRFSEDSFIFYKKKKKKKFSLPTLNPKEFLFFIYLYTDYIYIYIYIWGNAFKYHP